MSTAVVTVNKGVIQRIKFKTEDSFNNRFHITFIIYNCDFQRVFRRRIITD